MLIWLITFPRDFLFQYWDESHLNSPQMGFSIFDCSLKESNLTSPKDAISKNCNKWQIHRTPPHGEQWAALMQKIDFVFIYFLLFVCRTLNWKDFNKGKGKWEASLVSGEKGLASCLTVKSVRKEKKKS